MKKIILLGLICSSYFQTVAQNVQIPDVNLKKQLLYYNAETINTNGDEHIQLSEAKAFTGHINIPGSVSDFTGLEQFSKLTY